MYRAHYNYCENIVCDLAEFLKEKIAKKVVRDLKILPYTLSGDDSGLKNVWEEICFQIQHEYSFFWDAYDETVVKFVENQIYSLSDYERAALSFNAYTSSYRTEELSQENQCYEYDMSAIIQDIKSEIYGIAGE